MYSWALNAFSLVKLSEFLFLCLTTFVVKKMGFSMELEIPLCCGLRKVLSHSVVLLRLCKSQITLLTCFPWPCPSQLLQRIPSVLAGTRTPYYSLCLLPLRVHSANSCSRFNLSAKSPSPFLQSCSLASWSLACTYVWGFGDSGLVGLCIYWFWFTTNTVISLLLHLAMVSLNGNPMLPPMH